MAQRGELPDATIAAGELKITPLTNNVPEEATALMRQAYALLPHVKITDLLLEVDRWTGFSRHFTHLKTGQPCEDPTLLLTAILADAINLGIVKMAEACPGTTARKLDWLASLHIRDETYAKALTELVNHHHHHAFAEHWGEGKTSSSDGRSSALSRRFRVKRPELRGDLGSLAFRTFDLLLLVLRNAHGDCETLVALFAKIFVKGHRGILSIRREYNGLENLNTI